ncbi:MAG: hypothetical protein HUJ26_11765 [Planctomycetaceae bacterium]|nr:hypothetical protein [Planctomycetaceae bacterium]
MPADRIAHFPGRIPTASDCNEFLTLLELFPTFTQLMGAQNPQASNWKWVDSARGSGLFKLADDIGEKID